MLISPVYTFCREGMAVEMKSQMKRFDVPGRLPRIFPQPRQIRRWAFAAFTVQRYSYRRQNGQSIPSVQVLQASGCVHPGAPEMGPV